MANIQKKPLYQMIDGIRSPAVFSPICFREALSYKAQADDTFVASYPKAGTTWMQNIVLFIYRKGEYLKDYSEFFIHSPFLDMLGFEGVEKMPRPGSIKTHLPFTHIPHSADAKYIFVARNPRDVCVSFYYHTRTIPGLGYQDGVFDDFFELFMNGEVEYNDYFDHLLSWYPHRNDNNIYYATYEKMKADPKATIYQVAKFLGQEYVETLEKDNAVMNNILNLTSFQNMKQNLSDESDEFLIRDRLLADPNTPEGIKHSIKYTAALDLPKDLPKYEFVRKGIVGDWKSHFSQEQLKRLNEKSAKMFKGTELNSWWTY